MKDSQDYTVRIRFTFSLFFFLLARKTLRFMKGEWFK